MRRLPTFISGSEILRYARITFKIDVRTSLKFCSINRSTQGHTITDMCKYNVDYMDFT